jgi:hypothetical protein
MTSLSEGITDASDSPSRKTGDAALSDLGAQFLACGSLIDTSLEWPLLEHYSHRTASRLRL